VYSTPTQYFAEDLLRILHAYQSFHISKLCVSFIHLLLFLASAIILPHHLLQQPLSSSTHRTMAASQPPSQTQTVTGRVRVFIACSLDGFITDRHGTVDWLHSLPPPPADVKDNTAGYVPFIKDIGAMLMGRKCYDQVMSFDVPWPYTVPVLVASHRDLHTLQPHQHQQQKQQQQQQQQQLQERVSPSSNVSCSPTPAEPPTPTPTPTPTSTSTSNADSESGSTSDSPLIERIEGTIQDMLASALAKADGKDVYLDGGCMIRQALDAGLVDELIVTIVPILLGEGAPLFAGLEREHKLRRTNVDTLYNGMTQLTFEPAVTTAAAVL
jgi:dihydrofolate reductase